MIRRITVCPENCVVHWVAVRYDIENSAVPGYGIDIFPDDIAVMGDLEDVTLGRGTDQCIPFWETPTA
jgi:hypothetical protein